MEKETEEKIGALYKESFKEVCDDAYWNELVEAPSSNAALCYEPKDFHRIFKTANLDEALVAKWTALQESFISWTEDSDVYQKMDIEHNLNCLNYLFENIGLLKGNVLDIGGGWAVHRKWHLRDDGGLYLVHDPGMSRGKVVPFDPIQEAYQDVMDIPYLFVMGIGEILYYKDGSFDNVLIAQTLDHVLDPKRVLDESHRCLKPNGRIIITLPIQEAEADIKSRFKKETNRYINFLIRLVKDPSKTIKLFF